MKVNFKDCVKSLVEELEGILTTEQATALTDALEQRLKNLTNANVETAEALLRKTAGEFMEDAAALQALQRRNAFLTIQTRRQFHDKIAAFRTPGEGILAFIEGSHRFTDGSRISVERQKNGIMSKLTGEMLQNKLEEHGVLREFVNGSLDREIIREFYSPGTTNNAKAVKIREIVTEINRYLVDRQNQAGAMINFLPEHFGRQTYDNVFIRKTFLNGKAVPTEAEFDAGFKQFRDFILPRLDAERTFGDADPDKFLRTAFRNILEGVYSKDAPPTGQAEINRYFNTYGSLAKKVSSQRLFHYKDGDSAFEAMQMLGKHSFKEGVLSTIRYGATSISMLENFGPNPDMNFRNWLQEAKLAARDRHDSAAVDSLSGASERRVLSAYDKVAGKLDQPLDPTIHRWTSSALAITDLAKMGGVTLSAIPDPAFLYSTATYNGARSMDTIANMLGFFTRSYKGMPGHRARLLGAKGMLDSFSGEIASRFSMHEQGAHRMLHKANQKLFQINLMNWWNDRWSMIAIDGLTQTAGRDANLSFDALPPARRNMWRMMGISAEEWDMIRSTAYAIDERGDVLPLPKESLDGYDGKVYITPDQFSNIPVERIDAELVRRGKTATEHNRARLRNEIETKYRAWLEDALDESVLKPGGRESRMLTMGTQAGDWAGSFWRMLTHFKSFPLTVYTKIIRRELMAGGPKATSFADWLSDPMKQGKFRMLQLIAMTTVGGYLAGVLKDTVRGRTPKRLVQDGKLNSAVLLDAMTRGGSLGIYGDLVFSEYDRSFNTPLDALAGPVFGEASTFLMNLQKTAKQEEGVLKSWTNQVRNNTPLVNLFYIRPALDYLIFYNLQEMMDPGSVRDMERKMERETGQRFYLSPSDL